MPVGGLVDSLFRQFNYDTGNAFFWQAKTHTKWSPPYDTGWLT
jgi:hypothetical protein